MDILLGLFTIYKTNNTDEFSIFNIYIFQINTDFDYELVFIIFFIIVIIIIFLCKY